MARYIDVLISCCGGGGGINICAVLLVSTYGGDDISAVKRHRTNIIYRVSAPSNKIGSTSSDLLQISDVNDVKRYPIDIRYQAHISAVK